MGPPTSWACTQGLLARAHRPVRRALELDPAIAVAQLNLVKKSASSLRIRHVPFRLNRKPRIVRRGTIVKVVEVSDLKK